jgi:hypothetical protein
MRARYDDLLYNCPLPKLYGLSVMGTNMRLYTGDAQKMTLDPPRVPTSPNHVLDRTYLENAWNVDILSAEGFAKMKQIISYIKMTPLNNACMHSRLRPFTVADVPPGLNGSQWSMSFCLPISFF